MVIHHGPEELHKGVIILFNSLKAWVNIPAVVKPFEKRTGTGAKVFGEPVEIKCYPEGKVQVVTNKEGKEVVSNKILYVDGDTPVTELDNIVFEGRDTEVKAIGYYYRNGGIDIKLVYL